MRRRQPAPDLMATVPEELRDFRPDDWMPRLGLAAVQSWVDARQAWIDANGYPEPDGDPIPWLRHQIEVSRRVQRQLG